MSKKKIVDQRSNIKVAKNFIKSYGKDQFRMILSDFQNNRSGQLIGDELGVTRERVRQWKNAFGVKESFYVPNDLVVDVIENGQKEIDDNFGKTSTGRKRKMNKTERVIKNFVENRGINVFRTFINDSVNLKSGPSMKEKYGMTRERIRQLKDTFGKSSSTYTVHGYINALR